jgi:hypothetical protein
MGTSLPFYSGCKISSTLTERKSTRERLAAVPCTAEGAVTSGAFTIWHTPNKPQADEENPIIKT